MATESFRHKARIILDDMLKESSGTSGTASVDHEQLIEAYTDILTRLYAAETHQLLGQVLDDARMRLDARLSPDPLAQGMASVQTTMQDLWRSLWQE